MCSNNKKSLHIAMYPWFAFGHLTPFLHLANKFAERGHKVSFFLPQKTQLKLASRNLHPDLITFIPISVPHVDGLPDGAETTNDVPEIDRPKIMDAMDLTQDAMDVHLGSLKADFIFFDFTQWLPSLARKHGTKSIYYIISFIVLNAYFGLKARNLPEGHIVTEVDLISAPPNFPCPAIRLHVQEARYLAYVLSMDFGGMSLSERHSICGKECDAVAFKSCREIEGRYCDFVKKELDKPILLVGPAVPQPPASTLEDYFDAWLNKFDHGSVIYCALGSECVLEKDQFQELVLGLELTGRPFLAALKPPNGCETIELGLPEGYLEKIKAKGIIHGGWVQQQLILQHPSVGCFITHCGAGSTTEALLSFCQLVMLPRTIDQFILARMMSMDMRVGVEIEKGEEDGFFTKQAVYNAVTTVMEPENIVGSKVKANHAKWRSLLLSPGLEDSYIDELVQSLQNLL